MKELKEKLKKGLKDLKFDELVILMNKYNDSEIRGMILDTMQNTDYNKFLQFIGC